MLTKKPRILICPLDWGLGHAARCIPIIRYLLEKNTKVVIAADKRPLELLKREFPLLEFVVLPGYEVSYQKSGSLALQMIFSIPRIVYGIRRERRMLDKIIREKDIDVVISDNRYGLYHHSVPCVFITHQVNIQSPVGGSLLNSINRRYINKYTACWIPDFEGAENLSGNLSHKFPLPPNACFIGPLTRFERNSADNEINYDLTVLLSGPEPQRTIFEQKVIAQLRTTNFRTLIIRGITETEEEKRLSENIKMVSHLTSGELKLAILQSEVLLSRPGYSTVMDLACLGKKAIFVPTPGQTEQEYLGEYLMEKGIAYSVSQKNLNISDAFKRAEKYSGFEKKSQWDLYKKVVDRFLAF